MSKIILTLVIALAIFPVASWAVDVYTIQTRVQTPDGMLYDGDILLTSTGCTVIDEVGNQHEVTGSQVICLVQYLEDIKQFDATFGYYDGIGLYLKSITDPAAANYTNDAVNYSEYWSYFVNYVSPSVGMDAYTLNDGDAVVIAFGPYTTSALRLRLTDNESLAGDKITVRVQMPANASGIKFKPVNGASVYFNDTITTTDQFGKASYKPTADESSVTVYATDSAALTSDTETITVVERNKHSKIITQDQLTAMAALGVAKLKASINGADGLILGNQGISEWAAIGLAANSTSAGRLDQAVVDYEPTAAAGTNEIARHILALVALGYDPTNTNGIDYVARLQKTKSGKQFGSLAYINDDIFAGLALVASGEAGNSADVALALRAAKKGLNSDGGVSFSVASTESDVDTTAFYFQFMVAAENAGSTIPQTVARKSTLSYLKSQQNLDGGFGYSDDEVSNAASTAVALLAFNSVGLQTTISRNLRTPYNFLQSVQNNHGQFAYNLNFSSNFDVFNTAYAVIALSGQALPIVP